MWVPVLLPILVSWSLGDARPNIVTILVDDVGWNDVSFHGSDQIPTPNIDALAYNGVILNRHYTMPTCTPSRAAFLTGKYPIRTGMQAVNPILAGEPRGLPVEEVTLPQRLKQLGYVTRLVGKWHLGSCRSEFTPTRRGFDSFLGYWNGFVEYYNHTIHYEKPGAQRTVGMDFHRGMCATHDYEGRYATEVFTREAESIIDSHDVERPLYLHLSHLAAHHSGNDDDPLQLPDPIRTQRSFRYIGSYGRQLYAGVMATVDESVGRVVRALAARGMLNNTVLVFMSDNGAPTKGTYHNWGSNWPLRSMKASLHEGGVRNIAAIWSASLQQPGRVSNQLIHLTDWLPTLYSAAGGDVADLERLDGVDQWASLIGSSQASHQSHDMSLLAGGDVADLGRLDGVDQWASLIGSKQASPRTQLLLNVDEPQAMEALISGSWKIIKDTCINETIAGYHGDHGRGPENPPYDVRRVLASEVNKAIAAVVSPRHGLRLDRNAISVLRAEAGDTKCPQPEDRRADRYDNSQNPTKLCVDYCLFDIINDPCETHDLATVNGDKLNELIAVLNAYRKVTVAQLNKAIDSSSNPLFFNSTWVSWLDAAGSEPDHCRSPGNACDGRVQYLISAASWWHNPTLLYVMLVLRLAHFLA